MSIETDSQVTSHSVTFALQHSLGCALPDRAHPRGEGSPSYHTAAVCLRRLFRHHTTGGGTGAIISPLSMSPPDTPPGRRGRAATEGNEATKLLLPQGPMSAAGSGELGIGESMLPQSIIIAWGRSCTRGASLVFI